MKVSHQILEQLTYYIYVSNNKFSFIDSKTDTSKNLFISGKHVGDFNALDYMSLIPILIKGMQELNDEIKILKERINILESR